MTRLTQPAQIRGLLETDRPWAIYALGDLSPGYFEHSEWFAEGPGLALLYRAFATPVLFTLGQPEDLRPVMAEIGALPEAYLSIRPEVLPLVRERHAIEKEMPMWRMTLAAPDFRPAAHENVAPLTRADVPALEALFEDGEPAGEKPDFFAPAMVSDGVFYGVWEGGVLIAAAGTHLVSESESIGAVGNVYTRRDRRGRGLAAQTTSAVSAELLRRGLRTVALNVNQKNAAAIHVYERLGYKKYCPFLEGLAVGSPANSTVELKES